MSNLSELRKNAREYPGSIQIIEDSRVRLAGKSVSYVRYTNPNNTTSTEYVAYKCGDKEGSITTRQDVVSLDALSERFLIL